MLINLLPGLRELRAPLAAGYLWLLGLWLAFGESVPKRSEATGAWKQVLEAEDLFSAIGKAAALTFTAYLLGSFLSDALGWLWNRIRIWRLNPLGFPSLPPTDFNDPNRLTLKREWIRLRSWIESHERVRLRLETMPSIALLREASEPISPRSLDVMSDQILRHQYGLDRFPGYPENEQAAGAREFLARMGMRHSSSDSEDSAVRSVSQLVLQELDIARFRLLSEEGDLFHEADRLRAEGEFRLAVAPPLAVIAMLLAFDGGAIWAIALLPVALLISQGIRKLEESGDRLVDAIRARKVKVPALEQVESAMESMRPGSAGAQEEDPAPLSEAARRRLNREREEAAREGARFHVELPERTRPSEKQIELESAMKLRPSSAGAEEEDFRVLPETAAERIERAQQAASDRERGQR